MKPGPRRLYTVVRPLTQAAANAVHRKKKPIRIKLNIRRWGR